MALSYPPPSGELTFDRWMFLLWKDHLATADVGYLHNQQTPSNSWVIEHNLGKFPSVTVVDSAGTEVEGEVVHDSDKQVTLNFTNEFSGKAFLN